MIHADLVRVIDSIWYLLVSLGFMAVLIFPCMRIVQRTGHSGWWTLLLFVPIIGVFAPWILAYIRWPAVDGARVSN
jgi:hypothetical protein